MLNHNAEQFWKLYQYSNCAVEKRRCQLLALIAEGKSLSEALKHTGYSRQGAYKILAAYKERGLDSLYDRRHGNRGAPTLLTDEELYQLALAIRNEDQKWNGPSVQTWLRDRLNKAVYIARCYEYLEAFDPERSGDQLGARKTSSQVKRVLQRLAQENIQLESQFFDIAADLVNT